MEVHRVNCDFNFENISLANPQPVQGGSFFTKLSIRLNSTLSGIFIGFFATLDI